MIISTTSADWLMAYAVSSESSPKEPEMTHLPYVETETERWEAIWRSREATGRRREPRK